MVRAYMILLVVLAVGAGVATRFFGIPPRTAVVVASGLALMPPAFIVLVHVFGLAIMGGVRGWHATTGMRYRVARTWGRTAGARTLLILPGIVVLALAGSCIYGAIGGDGLAERLVELQEQEPAETVEDAREVVVDADEIAAEIAASEDPKKAELLSAAKALRAKRVREFAKAAWNAKDLAAGKEAAKLLAESGGFGSLEEFKNQMSGFADWVRGKVSEVRSGIAGVPDSFSGSGDGGGGADRSKLGKIHPVTGAELKPEAVIDPHSDKPVCPNWPNC